jgi:hypothetical protein
MAGNLGHRVSQKKRQLSDLVASGEHVSLIVAFDAQADASILGDD